MKRSIMLTTLSCGLCITAIETAAAGGVQTSRSVIGLPARLHGPRSESVVLRTGGAVIERVTPPAPEFKLTLREERSGCTPGAEC